MHFLGSADIDASYRNFSLPREYSSNDMFLKDENFDPCQMYALKDSQNLGSCDAESFNTSKTIECQSFVYDTSLFPETLTTKLDLVSFLAIYGSLKPLKLKHVLNTK